nr:MAG TPA: hypothetical protein [Microviridae sp.]
MYRGWTNCKKGGSPGKTRAIRVANKTTRCMPLYSVPGLDKL